MPKGPRKDINVKEILEKNKDCIIKSYKDGISTCELGRQFKVSNALIYLFLRDKCGIEMRPSNEKKANNARFIPDIQRMYAEGKTGGDMIRELGIPTVTLYRMLKRLGLDVSHRSTQRKDPLSNHKDEIIDLYVNKELSTLKIAKIFDTTDSSISSLLRKHNVQMRYKYERDHTFLDIIDTEEKAYYLGYFTGDGNTHKDNNVLTVDSTDLDTLEKMKIAMSYTGPIYNLGKEKEHHKPKYRLCVSSSQMKERMISLGCPPNKTFLTDFPSFDKVPKNLIRHFIRGLMEADGYIKKDRNGTWNVGISGTFNLTNNCLKYLQSILDVGESVCYKNRNIWFFNIAGNNQAKVLLNYLYQDASIYMDRKYNLYQKCIKDLRENQIGVNRHRRTPEDRVIQKPWLIKCG